MTNSATIDREPTFIEVGEGDGRRRIAVRARVGSGPGLFWLGGFNSDMRGTKALALDTWAAEHGRACIRFDYSGHGESGGVFIDGTIGRWLEESVAVFEQFCRGPQVVIGSSMGGWMALLLRPTRLLRSAIVLRPSTLLALHKAMSHRKYRMLFSPNRRRKPGPKGPSAELIHAVI